MRCAICGYEETKVLETRDTAEDITRRRRECLKCERRFTTYEQVELSNMRVVKKNGQRALFDRQKIIRSMELACQKRPVSQQQMEEIASKIEKKLRESMEKEIPTMKIGEYVMKELKKTDLVAYIRFASVYREFQDVKSFEKELEILKTRRR